MLSRAVQLKSESLKPIYEFFTKIYRIDLLFKNSLDFEDLKNLSLKKNY